MNAPLMGPSLRHRSIPQPAGSAVSPSDGLRLWTRSQRPREGHPGERIESSPHPPRSGCVRAARLRRAGCRHRQHPGRVAGKRMGPHAPQAGQLRDLEVAQDLAARDAGRARRLRPTLRSGIVSKDFHFGNVPCTRRGVRPSLARSRQWRSDNDQGLSGHFCSVVLPRGDSRSDFRYQPVPLLRAASCGAP